MIFDDRGRLIAVLGSPGGSRIIGYVLRAIVALVDWELDPQAAADLAHVVGRNGPTELERDGHASELKSALEARGHTVTVAAMTSGLHIIFGEAGAWAGGADRRREGIALAAD